MPRPRNLRQLGHLLLGIHRLRLRNNLVVRHAVSQQVIAPHAALGHAQIAVAAAAQRDHQRRDLLPVQLHRMVQPRMQHRRWPPGVLRRAKHRNRVRRPSLILPSNRFDLEVEPAKPAQRHQQRQSPAGAAATPSPSILGAAPDWRKTYSWQRNSKAHSHRSPSATQDSRIPTVCLL